MRRNAPLSHACVLASGLWLSTHALADGKIVPDADQVAEVCNQSAVAKDACKYRPRLKAFEPNYAIWQDTSGDAQALEAHYSFRYLLTRPHCTPGRDLYPDYTLNQMQNCINNWSARTEIFLAYTGEFDFYAGSRASSPVVNRISNPGIYLRRHTPQLFTQWVQFSVEHRSNGQVTEIDETDAGTLKTQIAYQKGDSEYLDGISRGANYLRAETKLKLAEQANLYVSAKIYIDHDSKVNWGPTAASNPKIADYDRVRFVYTHNGILGGKYSELSFEWLIGDDGLETDSFDLGLMHPLGVFGADLPLYIRYHNGPMNTLSDYTRKQKSLGIGMKLVF